MHHYHNATDLKDKTKPNIGSYNNLHLKNINTTESSTQACCWTRSINLHEHYLNIYIHSKLIITHGVVDTTCHIFLQMHLAPIYPFHKELSQIATLLITTNSNCFTHITFSKLQITSTRNMKVSGTDAIIGPNKWMRKQNNTTS